MMFNVGLLHLVRHVAAGETFKRLVVFRSTRHKWQQMRENQHRLVTQPVGMRRVAKGKLTGARCERRPGLRRGGKNKIAAGRD
jgi:hypothetical protein